MKFSPCFGLSLPALINTAGLCRMLFSSLFVLLSLLFLPVYSVQAETQSEASETVSQPQLLQLLIAQQRLTAAISLYSLNNGDSKNQQQLDQGIVQVEELLKSLKVSSAVEPWQKLKAFINQNRAEIASGEDAHFPRYYERYLAPLTTELTPLLDAEPQNAQLALSHALLTLETMRAAYLFYNMNIFGGFSVVDTGIEANNQRFKQQLKQLQQLQPQSSAALTSLERKWTFLEKTILAYNERSAVFIVNRTSSSISRGLEQLIAPVVAEQP